MLLEADWVVPVTSLPIRWGAVRVANGALTAVGTADALRSSFPKESTRRLEGCMLLPGLVNAHTHLKYSAMTVRLGAERGFPRWIMRLMVASRRLTPLDFRMSARWGALKCLRSGTTCIADVASDAVSGLEPLRLAGLRGRVYMEAFGMDDSRLSETLERVERELEIFSQESDHAPCAPCAQAASVPRWQVGVSPHAPYTVSARLYRELVHLARSHGLHAVTHLAESQAEVEFVSRGRGAFAHVFRAAAGWQGLRWEAPGVSPVAYLDRLGVLGADMGAVHCVQVDHRDIEALAARGAVVIHCPRSNLALVGATAPVAELRSAGVAVALGTDSLASNASLDMFEEMRAARAAAGSSMLSPADVLGMATIEGARALGLDRFTGSLEVGKRADLIAVKVERRDDATQADQHDDPAQDPSGSDPVTWLVERASGGDVRLVVVDGRVVFDLEAGGFDPEAEADMVNEGLLRAQTRLRGRLT